MQTGQPIGNFSTVCYSSRKHQSPWELENSRADLSRWEWEGIMQVQSGHLGGDRVCMAGFNNAVVNIPVGRRLDFCNSTLFLSSVLRCFLLVPFLFYCLFFKGGHPPGFHSGLLPTLPWEDHVPFR